MNKLSKVYFAGLMIIVFGIAAGAQSQSEMTRSACDEYHRVDQQLNQTYQQILRQYRSDRVFLQRLRAAQRAWMTFREAHLASLYPAPDPQRQYGSVHSMCRCQALTNVTNARIGELKRWVNGAEEGDVCAGSLKPAK